MDYGIPSVVIQADGQSFYLMLRVLRHGGLDIVVRDDGEPLIQEGYIPLTAVWLIGASEDAFLRITALLQPEGIEVFLGWLASVSEHEYPSQEFFRRGVGERVDTQALTAEERMERKNSIDSWRHAYGVPLLFEDTSGQTPTDKDLIYIIDC